ncbi:ankyrin repeat domain-containing protein 60 [Bufo gargarizans]|uniref:ankyrin repeat domain-containing protein 60 n=1 Tax=Bufo gargarizans TaxID=30331 RepID=UPI001CF49F35|nr:ankyrin repeat domain-containing protein 60 [Bufo gargarizans]
MASRGRVKPLQPGTSSPHDGHFTVNVRLPETGEKFSVAGCSQRMKVGELKEKLELLAGIPKNLQTLSHLDDGDMPDSSTFKFNGIFPGAKLSLSIWPYDGLTDLIQSAATGNLAKLIGVGVSPDSSFNTENSLRLNMKQKKEWLAARSGLALYVASHRGHLHVIRFLLQNGCNVQYKTHLGNTPLHAAAATGKYDCIDELLANGAQMQDTNGEGHTALDVARVCGHKKVERRLFFFQWEERAANLSIKRHLDPSELFAHQKHDSKLKTWLSGSHAKRYMSNLIPFQEFQGSHLSAPPKKNPV